MTKPHTTYQSGVRFRAYPESTLATTLRQWIGCQRVIYNGKVAEDRLFAAQRRMNLMLVPSMSSRRWTSSMRSSRTGN